MMRLLCLRRVWWIYDAAGRRVARAPAAGRGGTAPRRGRWWARSWGVQYPVVAVQCRSWGGGPVTGVRRVVAWGVLRARVAVVATVCA
jgi:hypothetical protein